MTETWLPVVGFESCFEVSDAGRIRRIGSGRGVVPGRILAQTPMNAGYLSVGMMRGNVAYRFLVHRVVAEAFHGPAAGREVNHRNFDKHDNRTGNLEWVTRSENLLHRSAAGIGVGTDNAQARINQTQVREVRRLHDGGLGYTRIAELTGIGWGSVRNIVKGRTWSHVA